MFSRRCKYAAVILAVMVTAAERTDAATSWLESSKRFSDRALSLISKAEEANADQTQLGRQALNSLNVAKMLLEKYDEPRPAEAAEALEDIEALMHWANRRLLKDPPKRPTGADSRLDSEAKVLLDKALLYAQEHADRKGVVTARFYEVVDKYPKTSSARVAARGRDFGPIEASVDLDPLRQQPPTSSKHSEAFTEFRRIISSSSADSAKVNACKGLLAELEIDDPARAEIVAVRAVFSADAASKGDALRAYRDAFARGLFADAMPKNSVRSDETADFKELTRDLSALVENKAKHDACSKFLSAHPDGAKAAEVRALQVAFDAKYAAKESEAWLAYLTAYPTGIATDQALTALEGAEPWFMLQLREAIAASDSKIFFTLSKTHQEVFPKSPNRAEIRSATDILSSDDAGRMRLAEAHLKSYRQGYLTPAVTDLIAELRKSKASSAVKKLLSRYAAAQTDASRVDACNDYLGKYANTPEADEVKLAKLMASGSTSKARLAAVRRYLERHPDGLFASAARESLQAYAAELEAVAYKELSELINSATVEFSARLDACEKYLEEYPEGSHRAEVSTAAAEIRGLSASEETAYQALLLELPLVASLDEAAQRCESFLSSYTGGQHFKEVLSKKSEYARRISMKSETNAYAQLMKLLRDDSAQRVAKAEACVAYLKQYEHGSYRGEISRELKRFASIALGPHQGPVYAAAFTSDSKYFITADADSSASDSGIWVWNLPQAALQRRWTPKPSFTATTIAATSPDTVLIGELHGGLSAWNILEGAVSKRIRIGRKATVSVSPCLRDSVVATADLGAASARLWTLPRLDIGRSYPCRGRVTAVAMSPDGELVAVGTASGRLAVFRTNSSVPEWVESKAHSGPIEQLAFSPRGSPLVSICSKEGVVCAWGSLSGTEAWCVDDAASSLAFVDAQTIATSSALRSARDGSTLYELDGLGPVAASGDGNFLLVGAEGNMATLWYLPALLQN